MRNTTTKYNEQLDRLRKNIELKAIPLEMKANQYLKDLIELFELADDYMVFRSMVLEKFPLGLMTWVDEAYVQKWAKDAGYDHIVDAIIDELSVMGARNALNRLKRALDEMIA